MVDEKLESICLTFICIYLHITILENISWKPGNVLNDIKHAVSYHKNSQKLPINAHSLKTRCFYNFVIIPSV